MADSDSSDSDSPPVINLYELKRQQKKAENAQIWDSCGLKNNPFVERHFSASKNGGSSSRKRARTQEKPQIDQNPSCKSGRIDLALTRNYHEDSNSPSMSYRSDKTMTAITQVAAKKKSTEDSTLYTRPSLWGADDVFAPVTSVDNKGNEKALPTTLTMPDFKTNLPRPNLQKDELVEVTSCAPQAAASSGNSWGNPIDISGAAEDDDHFPDRELLEKVITGMK